MISKKTFYLSFLLLPVAFLNCSKSFTGIETNGKEIDTSVLASSLTDVTVEGYDIIIVAGQSNAVGRAIVELNDNPIPLHLRRSFFANRVKQLGRYDNTFHQVIPAQEPLHHNLNTRLAAGQNAHDRNAGRDANYPFYRAGFAYNFALRVIRNLSPKRRILLVPVARGSTSILSWDNRPYVNRRGVTLTTNELFFDMLEGVEVALNKVAPGAASANQNRIIGMIWQQGEADFLAQVNSDHPLHGEINPWIYRERLKRLMNVTRFYLSHRFGVSEPFPILVGQMSWHIDHPTSSLSANSRDQIRENFRLAQLQAVSSDECSVVVSSQHLTTEEPRTFLHFDAASTNSLAFRYAEKFLAKYEDCLGEN